MSFQDNENNTQELMNIFQVETEDILERIFEDLASLEKSPANPEIIANLYRELHSIKGAVRMVGYTNIQNIIHKIEDLFDRTENPNLFFNQEKILVITKALELVSYYIHQSIENQREIIDDNYDKILENIEYVKNSIASYEDTDLLSLQKDSQQIDLQQYKEEINFAFNNCFEIIDSIVPEEESQEIILLKEEINKIYEFVKDSSLYEVKTSIENVLAKLDFVINATNTFTISEILELRNELSSAAAKYNTDCISSDSNETSFFDIAEKIPMLQGGSVYAKEIKEDILKLKDNVENSSIVEIINSIIEILDFIIENSVQLEEQMTPTLKSGIEYCASPNENIDGDLIVQQLEIMKQLLELNFKKDTGISEIKNLSTQNAITSKTTSSTEIKTLHVNAQKLDLLVNQLGELIITKIKTEKNLEKIDAIKNDNENCQKDLLKTSNYIR